MKLDGGDGKTILDGSLLPAGDGLHYEDGCAFRVNGLVIRGFTRSRPCRDFRGRRYFTVISPNQIIGNGASGIFVDARRPDFHLPPGAEIFENVIRGNGEWGIARTANGSI